MPINFATSTNQRTTFNVRIHPHGKTDVSAADIRSLQTIISKIKLQNEINEKITSHKPRNVFTLSRSLKAVKCVSFHSISFHTPLQPRRVSSFQWNWGIFIPSEIAVKISVNILQIPPPVEAPRPFLVHTALPPASCCHHSRPSPVVLVHYPWVRNCVQWRYSSISSALSSCRMQRRSEH